jgi:uncharacterized membrane protein YfcA
MEWYLYPAVVAAGFLAGFINTLAGSGSLVTLPLLIFIGLPANVANGTNRIAILLQNVVGVSSFRQQKILDVRRGLMLAAPAVIGSIIGAQIAVNLDEEAMRRVIGALMVVMLVVIIVRPKRWLEGRPEALMQHPSWIQLVIFFGIGIYGGFIQAGVGIVINGQVELYVGLVLAVGNMSGAWVASRMAVKRGAGFVRWLLIGVVIVSAVMLLGLFDLIAGRF